MSAPKLTASNSLLNHSLYRKPWALRECLFACESLTSEKAFSQGPGLSVERMVKQRIWGCEIEDQHYVTLFSRHASKSHSTEKVIIGNSITKLSHLWFDINFIFWLAKKLEREEVKLLLAEGAGRSLLKAALHLHEWGRLRAKNNRFSILKFCFLLLQYLSLQFFWLRA